MHLPESCEEFKRVLGLDLTLRLVDVAKDRRIYIPANPVHADHPLAVAVGQEAAERLRRQFGGCVMPYPARSVRALIRDREIVRDWQAGQRSYPALAIAYNVCERTIHRAMTRVSARDLTNATDS